MTYNTSCPAVERFENIEPFGNHGTHAGMLRDENGLRYVVWADREKVWPIYLYDFGQEKWYGIRGQHQILKHIAHVLVYMRPVEEITWITPLRMATLAHEGTAATVVAMMVNAAKGDQA